MPYRAPGPLQLAAALLPLAAAVAALFASLAPEPYMDEPFHVPQTRRYCEGRWREWDPKITTFPGLYLFGAAVGRLEWAAQRLAGAAAPQLCSTAALRSVGLLFGAACLPLFWAAAAALDPARTPRQLALMTAACYLFPLHFFFNFLYYTDVPSLAFILASYLAARRRRHRAAGALGAAAVLMRQTNAVWLAFALATAVLDRCLPEAALGGSTRGGGAGAAGGRGGRSSRAAGSKAAADEGAAGASAARTSLLGDAAAVLQQAWAQRRQLAGDLWPLAAVVAAFAAFVVLNGGIVVGDKAHHAPVRHLAQPLYCLLYCTAWLAPAFYSPRALAAAARQLRAALRRRPAATAAAGAAAAAAAAAAIARGTLVHPFLLADNRHLTFYLWRRVLNATPWARYALLPPYLYSGWALGQRLAHRGALWVAGLAGATCLVLVPAHLAELRYFTVPFYLVFLHMRTPSTRALAATVALFAAANAAALWLFLARPFTWPDGSIARFMW